jgi:hypothetical protein
MSTNRQQAAEANNHCLVNYMTTSTAIHQSLTFFPAKIGTVVGAEGHVYATRTRVLDLTPVRQGECCGTSGGTQKIE